jgi:hypothetical protein
MSQQEEANESTLAALRTELGLSPPAAALRTISKQFGLNRTDLAFLVVDAYENILTPEVQAIWHWDLSETGKGHSDSELNNLLSHLVLKAHA